MHFTLSCIFCEDRVLNSLRVARNVRHSADVGVDLIVSRLKY